MDDKQILELLWERSREAISALETHFGGRLQRTAMNILGNKEDAEEAVNDTYLALWDAIPPERPDPLEGYVYRTGRNVALKKLRFQSAQKRSAAYDLSLDELSDILPGESIEDILDARALRLMLVLMTETNMELKYRNYQAEQVLNTLPKTGINTFRVKIHRS